MKKLVVTSLLALSGIFLLLLVVNRTVKMGDRPRSDQNAGTDQGITIEERTEEKAESAAEKFSEKRRELTPEKEDISQYYGVYEIKEYQPGNTESRGYNRLCNLPKEEADLLIGQKIVFAEDKFAAYDNFRLGGRSGDRELSDYRIKKYVIDDPEYTIREISYDRDIGCFDGYPENIVSAGLEYPYRLIELPNQEDLAELSRMTAFIPHLYVMEDRRLMWCCETCAQWFVAEKVADVYEEEDVSLPSEENGQIPAQMCGSYEITEFYPTVYWEDRQVPYERGYLSPDDAQSMIGRRVFLGTGTYQGYSFDASAFAEDPPRCESEIIKVDSENTNYLVKDVKRSELYGLRESILPEIYEQDVYKEVTVPLSTLNQELENFYFCSTKYYQLDADHNKILMLFMKEFFLLEKTE